MNPVVIFFIGVIAIASFFIGGMITASHLSDRPDTDKKLKTASVTLRGYKTYATITAGTTTYMMLGYSVTRQLQIAGYKYKAKKVASYSSTDEFELSGDPEVIGLVKLYCDNGGYANMHLHEFITRTIGASNAKTSWLSKLWK